MIAISENNRHWWILGAASCVLGLVVLDETVIGVALPTIRTDLSMTEVASHWVVNAYLLTFTCFVAVGGRLGDMLGRRNLFVIGAALFAFGSLMAGTAQSGLWLIAARAVQGIGSAVIFPASLAIISNIFPPEQRGTAFGIQVTIAAVFMASGPLVGGLFTQLVSWRWIFLINLPITAVITAIVFVALKPSGQRKAEAFDYAGLTTLVLGLSGIVVALMQSTDWGWTAPATLTMMIGGLIFMAVFIIVELRRTDPLIELDLLKVGTFTGGNIVFFMFQFEKLVIFIFVSLYLQHVLHMSPIDAGLIVTIAIVPALFTSSIAGRLKTRYGSRVPLTISLAVTSLAILAVTGATVLESRTVIVVALLVWGAVMPGIAVTARSALLGALPAEKQGQGSGINLSIQMLGGTIGIAICSVLLAATGAYWLVFLVTGCGVVVSTLIAWLMVEPPAKTKQ